MVVEMTQKFKVGDRVRTINWTCILPIGIEATIDREEVIDLEEVAP